MGWPNYKMERAEEIIKLKDGMIEMTQSEKER